MKHLKLLILINISFISLFCNQDNTKVIYIKPLETILAENPLFECLKCFDKMTYEFPVFFDPVYHNKITFDECFILSIPQGRVQGFLGNVLINNDSYIQEMVWAQNINTLSSVVISDQQQFLKLPGKMVVLAQPSCDNYCHFIHEILGRLALIEMNNIEYDYLYIPCFKPFMLELLSLWGVDLNKVIYPKDNTVSIQTDTLFLPSLVINTNIGFNNTGFRPHPMTSEYVKNKLLDGALKLGIDTSHFSKKVFISRKDAPKRRIINEDQIFELFEPYGFVSYELSTLTVAEQIMLMHQAEVIVGEHGAGLTNVLFCKPNTLVLEIFQKLIDNSDWWVANIAGAHYIPINALDQDALWAADWKSYQKEYSRAWAAKTVVPLEKIEAIIEKYLI